MIYVYPETLLHKKNFYFKKEWAIFQIKHEKPTHQENKTSHLLFFRSGLHMTSLQTCAQWASELVHQNKSQLMCKYHPDKPGGDQGKFMELRQILADLQLSCPNWRKEAQTTEQMCTLLQSSCSLFSKPKLSKPIFEFGNDRCFMRDNNSTKFGFFGRYKFSYPKDSSSFFDDFFNFQSGRSQDENEEKPNKAAKRAKKECDKARKDDEVVDLTNNSPEDTPQTERHISHHGLRPRKQRVNYRE